MNLTQFFEHWSINENPFRGEEARQDAVFSRIGVEGDQALPASSHSDFEKVLGQLDRPSTSIVFGEKGSGKTAIRLQIAAAIARHNKAQPDGKAMLIAYDELNSILDRFHERARGGDVMDTLKKLRLVDHIDGLLLKAIPGIVDTIVGETATGRSTDLGEGVRRRARGLDPTSKRDLLLLQAVYDRAERADDRTTKLRKALKVGLPPAAIVWAGLAYAGWLLPAAVVVGFFTLGNGEASVIWNSLFFVALAAWLFFLFKRVLWDAAADRNLAKKVRKQVRVTTRTEHGFARSLAQIDDRQKHPGALPITDSEDTRYALLDRLRQVLVAFGYRSIIVVVDRVDEPSLINGDADRMRAVVWPMLNNKFLQQDGVGIKMLLPIELRHALYKESSQFFQEARLDKQNMVDRLSWSGAMLYDLCEARLRACRPPEAEHMSLLDLFAEDVTRQDLVDALEQMHQPRDAFKFIYACLNEHCQNVTAEEQAFRVPRLVLDAVRKRQAERVQQLYRGIGPA
ncbi:MAG: hypothetical protein AAGF47_05195 [Planctomycetota bacterium]